MNKILKWDISHLFNNGNFYNLPELVSRLDLRSLDSDFDVVHEKTGSEDYKGSRFSDLDHLLENYDSFKSLSLNKEESEEVKIWFAESCFLYLLFYAYNLKTEKYAAELGDLKSEIEKCVKIFIQNGLKSLGYNSEFDPHPDYCINPPEKHKFFNESKKQYKIFIENGSCDDNHFEFVLYMFLNDFFNNTLPEKNNFTKNYKSILLNISEWIGYSKNQEYYDSMVNNFIINYYFYYTAQGGNKPNFYEFGQRYESQILEEKNHAYKGMLEVAFTDRKNLCRWFHYDSLFLGKNPKIEDLAKLTFGEIFYTSDSSIRLKEIFTSIMNSENVFSKPGLILMLYFGIKRMNFDDFKDLFIAHDPKSKDLTKKLFEQSVSSFSYNINLKDTDFHQWTTAYIDSQKNNYNSSHHKMLQALFYFLIWDLSSKYQLRYEDEHSNDIDPLFDKKKKNGYPYSAREVFMNNFYKPLEHHNWFDVKTIENLLNKLAVFFKFKTQNPFNCVDFSELKTGKIKATETLSTIIFNLAQDECNNVIRSQIDYIKFQQEHSIYCIPNFRKEYQNDAERKEKKDEFEKNQIFIKTTDTGFELKEFEQCFYPFNYKVMSISKKNTAGTSSYILGGYVLRDEKNSSVLNHSFQYSLKRKCICKFIVESDTNLTITNGSSCKLRIDSNKRFRSSYSNNFSHAYLNYHRNKETHNSYYTPIQMLLYNENTDKKYLLTSLFDIKEQLSEEIEKLPLTDEVQLFQLVYLKAQCDEIFKLFTKKYFPEIIDEDCWNAIFKNKDFYINQNKLKDFNNNFNIKDFDTEIEKMIIDFFNTVWNVEFIFFDTRINNVSHNDMNFFQRYEIPIKLYEIYLSLSFQKYDGENNHINRVAGGF